MGRSNEEQPQRARRRGESLESREHENKRSEANMDDDWDADDWEAEPLPALGSQAPAFEDEEEEEKEVVVRKAPQKPTVKKVEKAPRNYDDPSDLFGMVDETSRDELER